MCPRRDIRRRPADTTELFHPASVGPDCDHSAGWATRRPTRVGDAISVQTSTAASGCSCMGPQVPAVHSPTHSPALRRRVALPLHVRPSDVPMASASAGPERRIAAVVAMPWMLLPMDFANPRSIHPELSQSCMTQQPQPVSCRVDDFVFSASLPSLHVNTRPSVPSAACPCVSSPPGQPGLPPHGPSDSPLS